MHPTRLVTGQYDGPIEDALHALRTQTGINSALNDERREEERGASYATVELRLEGTSHRLVAEYQFALDRKEAAKAVKSRLLAYGEAAVLITPYVSKEIADYCRDIDLQFIDAAGNAYLHKPGLHVYIKGLPKPAGRTRVRVKSLSAAALRIHFLLLSTPSFAIASYREIARQAQVSLGAVSGAFEDLRRRGFLSAVQGSGRRVLNVEQLLRQWVTTYPLALRPKLHSRRYAAPNADWWREASTFDERMAWSGEVAAERLTGYLKPATQMIYLAPEARSTILKSLVQSHRLRLDPDGPIEILDRFWAADLESDHPGIAPPLLVYADLVSTLDSRNIEAAKLIKERYIDSSLHTPWSPIGPAFN